MKNYNYEKSIRNFAKGLQLGEPFWSGDNMQMLCPFHIEENASFGINTSTQLVGILASYLSFFHICKIEIIKPVGKGC